MTHDLTAAVERAYDNCENFMKWKELSPAPREQFLDALAAEHVYVASPEQQKALGDMKHTREVIRANKHFSSLAYLKLLEMVDRVLALSLPSSDYHAGLLAALHVCENASHGTHPACLADEIRGMAARAVPSANLSVPEVRESESRTMAGWRPIAEYDGPDETAVLVFSSDGTTVGRKSYGTWVVDNAHGYCEDGTIYGVTHWMPLPPKPEGAL